MTTTWSFSHSVKREQNLKLNKTKLKLYLSEVACMGHRLSRDGLSPDPMKTKTIQEIPGCLQYLSCFLPWLAKVAVPLQALTENVAVLRHFKTLKTLITKALVLKFCNVTEEATIQCDGSGSHTPAKGTTSRICITFTNTKWTKLCTDWKRVLNHSICLRAI